MESDINYDCDDYGNGDDFIKIFLACLKAETTASCSSYGNSA